MKKSQLWLTLITIFLIVASLWYLYPSLKLWTLSDGEKAILKEKDPQMLFNLERKGIKLGLDLKGGMHVVLQVDKAQLKPEESRDAVDRALEIIRNRVDQFGVAEPLIQKQGEDRIIVELPGLQDVERAQNLIGQTAQLEFRLLETQENTVEVLKKIDEIVAQEQKGEKPSEKKEKTKEMVKDLFSQEVVDTTLAEEGQEEDWLSDKPFTSMLESSGSNFFLVPLDYKLKVEQNLKDPKVQGVIPEDDTFAWATRIENIRGEDYQKLYLLKKRVELSGKYLTEARETFDQFHRPQVNFTLTREGGREFARLTGANIDKPLGIILDGRVESTPIIRARIRESGVIELGGGTIEDAHDLAVVLRAGALPAPVKIIENRVIGPSLGQDSINKGVKAAIVGITLVVLFMAIYYKLSGIIADIALILNLVFVLAALAGLHATLTLPGIAGIILTIGMSVDSNVLIFERIREELRTGKTVRASIDAGYKRALLTIIDAHVTTLITAAVLFQFGTGPIKGFAVTLSLGVIISLFTAVVVTRLIFNVRKKYQSLSI
jgi:SecD/SecF fusion protein